MKARLVPIAVGVRPRAAKYSASHSVFIYRLPPSHISVTKLSWVEVVSADSAVELLRVEDDSDADAGLVAAEASS